MSTDMSSMEVLQLSGLLQQALKYAISVFGDLEKAAKIMHTLLEEVKSLLIFGPTTKRIVKRIESAGFLDGITGFLFGKKKKKVEYEEIVVQAPGLYDITTLEPIFVGIPSKIVPEVLNAGGSLVDSKHELLPYSFNIRTILGSPTINTNVNNQSANQADRNITGANTGSGEESRKELVTDRSKTQTEDMNFDTGTYDNTDETGCTADEMIDRAIKRQKQLGRNKANIDKTASRANNKNEGEHGEKQNTADKPGASSSNRGPTT